MEPQWRYITATMVQGRLEFTGTPPFPDCDPEAGIEELAGSLLAQGWEYVHQLSTSWGVVLRHVNEAA